MYWNERQGAALSTLKAPHVCLRSAIPLTPVKSHLPQVSLNMGETQSKPVATGSGGDTKSKRAQALDSLGGTASPHVKPTLHDNWALDQSSHCPGIKGESPKELSGIVLWVVSRPPSAKLFSTAVLKRSLTNAQPRLTAGQERIVNPGLEERLIRTHIRGLTGAETGFERCRGINLETLPWDGDWTRERGSRDVSRQLQLLDTESYCEAFVWMVCIERTSTRFCRPQDGNDPRSGAGTRWTPSASGFKGVWPSWVTKSKTSSARRLTPEGCR